MAARNEISWRDGGIALATIAAQPRFFHLAERAGFTRKVISLETGIPIGTLNDWAGTTQMPLAGFNAITGIEGFPNEIASVLTEPASKSICDCETEETDLDDAALAAVALLNRYVAARHPNSSSGVAIDHTEKPGLRLAAEGYADRASKVATA